jgi:hypothetical protein
VGDHQAFVDSYLHPQCRDTQPYDWLQVRLCLQEL